MFAFARTGHDCTALRPHDRDPWNSWNGATAAARRLVD
jgi:hypothetical protein